MRVYIAACTPERQFVKSYRSLFSLKTREGDLVAEPEEYARGDTTRIRFGRDFLAKKEYDAILLLDLDMRHPPYLLEKLRSHDVDMVTGHYFKRGSKPMMSVCSVGENWPYEPLFDIPTDGLHKISNTGLGCCLIKREVVEAVNETLGTGEPVFALGPMPEAAGGDYGTFGSDFRFFSRARALGYTLWLDASVESMHGATIWLTRALYEILRPHQMSEWVEHWGQIFEGYGGIHEVDKQAAEVRIKTLETALKQAQEQADRWLDKIKVISGQISEREFDTKIDARRPMKVPVLSDEDVKKLLEKRKEPPADIETLTDTRREIYQREADELAELLKDDGTGKEETIPD